MHTYDAHELPYFISSSGVMQFREACYTAVSYAPYIRLQMYTITILATFGVTIFDFFSPWAPAYHLLGNGAPLGSLVCDVFLYFCHFPIQCPGSGSVLDCIDSTSLVFYLFSLTRLNLCLSQLLACHFLPHFLQIHFLKKNILTILVTVIYEPRHEISNSLTV